MNKKDHHEEMFFLTGDLMYIWLRNYLEAAQIKSDFMLYAIQYVNTKNRLNSVCNHCGRPVITSGYPAEFGISCRCQVRNKYKEIEKCVEAERRLNIARVVHEGTCRKNRRVR